MAAVTFTGARPCTPVGYEFVRRGVLLSDVSAGTLLAEGSTGWDKNGTSAPNAMGIALYDGVTGETIDIGIVGEMDLVGATLTPGTAYYPSGSTAGGIDSTATVFYHAGTTPAVDVPVKAQMRATKIANSSRTVLSYNFLP